MLNNEAQKTGKLIGIGVGPGPAGLIPVAAVNAISDADIVYAPRAKESLNSVAKQCIADLRVPPDKIREILYNMETDRSCLQTCYENLAQEIAAEIAGGKAVVYLTIGDTLTYSTYGYMLQALLAFAPEIEHATIPGITSYAAVAAAIDWPLGQGKERTLILPCPSSISELQAEIENHDVVVLMKIGHRLPMVLKLIDQLGIASLCGFASRLGFENELIIPRLTECAKMLQSSLPDDASNYLSTMLIRKTPFFFHSEASH